MNTTALDALRPGDLFRLDDGPALIYVDADHNETTPEVRIRYRDPNGHPAHVGTRLVADLAEVAIYHLIPARDVRPGDRIVDGDRVITVGAVRTYGKKARVTTIDPAPFRGDPMHRPADTLLTVERKA